MKWISVKDRLPKTIDRSIIVFDDVFGVEVANYRGVGYYEQWEGYILRNVTHWMPFPEPPKE